MNVLKSLKQSFAVAGEVLFGAGLKKTLLEMNERMSPGYSERHFGVPAPKPDAKP